MRLAGLAYERAIWPHIGSTRAASTLNGFYNWSANRLMAHFCLTFLAGLATLLALETYGVMFQMTPSPITFRGVYAWETAINFGLCHFLIDEGSYRLGAHWPGLKTRTISRLWLIWLVAFVLFMLMQRTVVYERTIHYHPAIVQFYSLHPDARPDFVSMTLFCFPFWLMITTLTRQLMLTAQTRRKCDKGGKCWSLSATRREVTNASNGILAKQSLPPTTSDLKLNSGGHQVHIHPDGITHVSVEDHYCRFSLRMNDTYNQVMALTPLKAVVNQLPSDKFIQIHRSHVVRLDAVCSLRKKGRSYHVGVLPGDVTLPISRQRQPQCLKVIRQQLEDGQNAN